MKNKYKYLVRKSVEKIPLVVQGARYEGTCRINLAQDKVQWQILTNTVMCLLIP
jgi:hypothetical protein